MLHDEFYGWCASLNEKAMYIDLPLSAYRQHGMNTVGSKKFSRFQSIDQMKKQVQSSSVRTLHKFIDVKELDKEHIITKEVEDAIDFYRFRVGLFESNNTTAFLQYIKNLFEGNYRKYTSETEKARLKDLCCILF